MPKNNYNVTKLQSEIFNKTVQTKPMIYVENIKLLVKKTEENIKNINKEIKTINIKNSKNEKHKENINVLDRDTRHFAPASREWNNSVYTFNKNNLTDVAIKDNTVSNYIKNYFNLTPIPMVITKSKRMRDLVKRSSTKQLFVSKPEIKQTNDKAIINVYTYDREKKLFFRELYALRKWLNESLMGRKLKKSTNNLIKKFTKTNKKYKRTLMFGKHIVNQKNFYTYRQKQSKLRKYASKYKVKSNLYKKTINMLLRKKSFFTNVVVFKFIKFIYKLLNTKIRIIPSHYYTIGKGKKMHTKVYVNVILKENKKKKLTKTKEGKIRFVKIKPFEIIQMRKSYFNLNVFKEINMILLKRLKEDCNNLKTNSILSGFKRYKNNYKKALYKKYLKKELLIVKYLSKLYSNKFKFHTYLPGLKSILSKIYNKKIKLNLVNLKYLQLNSNMFSEAIAIKLRKRTTGLYRLLRKSFNLVKTLKPNEKFINLQKKNSFDKINIFFGKYNVINGDVMNKVFKEMFNGHLNTTSLNTTKEILRSLKYKWVTGARIEAKGRLTKRYAASRALFKYKYRGALRNLEYLNNTENQFKSPSVFMLRGEHKPNNQYSFVHSKRRIGAFGIKGWISNS